MRRIKCLPVLAFLFIIMVPASCRTTPKASFVDRQLDSTIRPIKISINKLAKDYKSLHGQYIETTGRFSCGFEEFALYADKKLFSELKGFWLDTRMDLVPDWENFGDNIQWKRIRIKGRIDTLHKGHLSAYLATIDNVYFFEEQ